MANPRLALHARVLQDCNGCNPHVFRNHFHHESNVPNSAFAKSRALLWLILSPFGIWHENPDLINIHRVTNYYHSPAMSTSHAYGPVTPPWHQV